MNTDTDTRQEIVEAVLNEPRLLKTVRYRHPKWWGRVLQILWILPRTKDLLLTAATATTLLKVTSLLGALHELSGDRDKLMAGIYRLITDNLPAVMEAVAVGIHNGRGEPPTWLVEAIQYDLTQEELAIAAYEVHRRLGIENFFVIMGFLNQSAAHDMLATEVHGPPSAESSSTTD